ncbi:hypothetical protein [Methanobrevibacter sp.]|uniref:hypothetical protein n=1 Tax=Methanobrevibacter sp. TaxID=66852 RepID=UPI00386D28E6
MLVELTLINIFLNLLLISIWLKRGFMENRVTISVMMVCLVLNMICVMLYI